MPNHTFPLDGPIELHVRIGHGSVTVETEDDLAAARVELQAGKNAADLLEQTVVELRHRTLVVVAPRQGGIFDLPVFGRWANRGLDVRIVVPTRTPVEISTFTAPIRIPGHVGRTDLTFGAGEAAVRHVDGDLRLRFGSGTAKAVEVTGSVTVRSGSGSAQFGEVGGSIQSGFGSGNLSARIVHGAVRSRCGSGTATLNEVHGDVDLASGSGGLEIGLPPGVSARVDVHSGSGQVRSEMPIEGKPASPDSAISVRARTGSGDVHIFRAA